MVFLDELLSALYSPLHEIGVSLAENFLGLAAAAAVIVTGYLIGSAVAYVISFLIEKSNVDQHLERIHVHDALGFIKLHALLGTLLKWYIVSLFLSAATDLIASDPLRELMYNFSFWLPKFLFGTLVFVLGLIIAEIVYRHALHFKTKGLRFLAEVLKIVIILIVGLTALEQMEIDITLASIIVLILIGGIILAAALSFGIGFGLAFKDEAKDMLKGWKKH